MFLHNDLLFISWAFGRQMAFHLPAPKCLNASYLHGRQTKAGTSAKLFDCFCHALDSGKASFAEAEAAVPAGTKWLITRSAIMLMAERMLCGASSL